MASHFNLFLTNRCKDSDFFINSSFFLISVLNVNVLVTFFIKNKQKFYIICNYFFIQILNQRNDWKNLKCFSFC
jgi:hypothetical protein